MRLIDSARLAACLGLMVGAVEVALRATPHFGLSHGQVAVWLVASMVLSALFVLVFAPLKRPGVLVAAPVLLHCALFVRFDLYVNAMGWDPRLWIGLGASIVAAAGAGWLSGRVLGRHARRAELASLLVALVASGVALGRSTMPHGEARAERPNVLLITLDTTRADRIGAYAGTGLTPNVDRLAAQGVLFERVSATAPLTEPSHLAVLSGRTPIETGVVANGTPIGFQPEMLQHTLGQVGYTTAAFVSAFPLHGRFGWPQGFDVYDDDFGRLPGLHRLNLVKAVDQVTIEGHVVRERRGDLTVDRTLSWLDSHAGEAFFLWVHLFDAHSPYDAPDHPFDPPPAVGEPVELKGYWPAEFRKITSTDWLIGAYEAEIRYADVQLGRLLDAFVDKGLLDDTVVVLTADHGESLTEHDLYFEHGDNLHDPSLRVPMIVRYPPVAVAGHRSECLVSNVDVRPTLLDILHMESSRRSLVSVLGGGPCQDRPVVATTVGKRFVDDPPVYVARIEGRYKVIQAEDVTTCYDLLADPGERSPLEQCPDLEVPRSRRDVSPRVDPQARDALRALGYVE